MMSPWAWVEPIRDKHFGKPLAGLYPFERTTREAYWDLHEKEMMQHFPEEVFFDFWTARGDDEKADKARLTESMDSRPLEDFWVARDGGEIVMMGSGHQIDGRVYRMWHTNVHPKYRGRGLYHEYVRRLLDYTKEVGFRAVKSEHAPSNNAVIIAKLRAGFRIYSLEMDPAAGPSLCLRFFHDPTELAAYEYRCGMATMNKDLLARGAGAAPKLIDQFRR